MATAAEAAVILSQIPTANTSRIEVLKANEKRAAQERMELRKAIKKERRKSRQLQKRLGKIPEEEILNFLAQRVRAAASAPASSP